MSGKCKRQCEKFWRINYETERNGLKGRIQFIVKE